MRGIEGIGQRAKTPTAFRKTSRALDHPELVLSAVKADAGAACHLAVEVEGGF
jgi:hypothetical protein